MVRGMIYASMCDGIGGAHCAFQPLGWKCAFVSEIEPFPNAVVAQRWGFENRGDMTKYQEWPDGTVDLVCGGTPCQAFSVAGLRGGIKDPRGNLCLVFLGVVAKYRPRWVVWENVPGVLSSGEGRDFGAFLRGLVQLGYGWAYRVLDAQYFGVPQRRRRVFVVGCAGGEWQRAATVLFDGACLSGNPAPSREARKNPAPTISARTKGGGGLGTDFDCDGGLIANTCNSNHGNPQTEQTMIPCVVGALSDGAHNGGGRTDRTHTQDESLPSVAWALQERDAKGADSSTKPGHLIPISNGGGFGDGEPMAFPWQVGGTLGMSGTLVKNQTMAVAFQPRIASCIKVRRITPSECEKLQGFPPEYTAITYRGKAACDGPRYKALGNSWAVPCARWIGNRINMLETP